MRKILFYLTLVLTATACVPKTDYDQLEKKYKALTEEVVTLKTQIDELKNGEERLVNLAKNSIDAGNYIEANKFISDLKPNIPNQKRFHILISFNQLLTKKYKLNLKK